MSARSTAKVVVQKVDSAGTRPRSDRVIAEEPLELRVLHGANSRTVAVTMRTPGSDFELAAGFLFSEGIARERTAIKRIDYCSDLETEQLYNVVNVRLSDAIGVELQPLERHFFTSSACGVCGKAGIDSLEARVISPVGSEARLSSRTIGHLAEALRASQRLFEQTGGLHAAGLFSLDGETIATREDVGRHNAVDKVIGWAFLQGRVPLDAAVLVVSGRASFEILQKAAVAGIQIVCAVSAPTSLAVSTAERFGITLVGFMRGSGFNIYSGRDRIEVDGTP